MAKNVKTFRLISHLQFGADCVVFGVCWRETCLTSFAQEITSFFFSRGNEFKIPLRSLLKTVADGYDGEVWPEHPPDLVTGW